MKNHTYRIVGLGLILASGCNQILGLNQGEPLPMEKGGNGGGTSSTGSSTGTMSGSSSTGGAGGAGGGMPECDGTNPCDDQKACTIDVCNALGMCEFPARAVGEACGVNMELACDGMGNCVGCVDASACPGEDTICQARSCIGGMCGFVDAPTGTAAGDPTLGDCQQDVCNGIGGTMPAAADTDTPSDATVCTADSCSNGLPTFTPVVSGTMCSEGNGTYCDGAGECKLGYGAVCTAGSECASSFCADGVCCTGPCTTACTSCNLADAIGICTNVPFGLDDGACSEAKQSCDGAGACKNENGQSCAIGGDCFSGVCAGGLCSAQSCIGLSATCGPLSNENCCESSVVMGGIYNRSNDVNYPATVSDFRLDRFEITVGRFRKFVEAYPASKPSSGAGAHPLIAGSGWSTGWNGGLPTDQAALKATVKCNMNTQTWTDTAGANENRPMNCINWYESFAFCAWDGGRLPTEAEWNYASAGGNQQRQYPWGAAVPDATYAVYGCNGNGNTGDCVLADILTGGSKSPQGDGLWGQADLAGSVHEWNLDWYQQTYALPCTNCANVLNGSGRLVRGGNWYDAGSFLVSSIRPFNAPTNRGIDIGARCARTP